MLQSYGVMTEYKVTLFDRHGPGGALHLLAQAVGDGASALATGGHGSASENQFSYQESLVMQGRVDDALASFEALIAASATAIEPRILAADLYSRNPANARRAAELLREAQRIPAITPFWRTCTATASRTSAPASHSQRRRRSFQFRPAWATQMRPAMAVLAKQTSFQTIAG